MQRRQTPERREVACSTEVEVPMAREDTLDRKYREQMIRGSRLGTPSSAGNT